jgi:hypothetical protein
MVLNTVNWEIGGKGGAMRRLGNVSLIHPLRDMSALRSRAAARRFAVGAASLLFPALLVACGVGGAQTLDGAPSDEPTPSAPAVLSAPTQVGPDAELVLRAYQGYWAAQIRAMSTGRADGSNLSTYATDAALSDSYADVVRLVAGGLVMSGAPRSSASVTALGPLAGAAGESQATVVDCLDVSGWHQVVKSTGQVEEPAKRLSRYWVVATARTVGGVWMISQITRETGRTC